MAAPSEKKAAELIDNPQTVAQMHENGVFVGLPVEEDTAALEALYKRRDDAHKLRNWEMLRDTIDFPVWMVSDTSEHEAVTWLGDESKLLEVQGNIMRAVPRTPVEHQRRFIFLTSGLALNLESNWVMVGAERLEFKAAHVLVKRGGQWKVKSVVEGGWGNLAQRFGTDFKMDTP